MCLQNEDMNWQSLRFVEQTFNTYVPVLLF